MKLLIFACLLSAASACCLPPIWTANVGLQYAKYDEAAQNGTYLEGTLEVFYNSKLKMVSQNQVLNIDDKMGVKNRLVMDYNQGITFLIQEDGSCSKHMLAEVGFDCLPDNATDGSAYNYGLGDNFIKTNLYQFDLGPTNIYMTVTADTCVPVSEDTWTRKGSIAIMMALSYANVKASITDDQAFYVPVSCTKNTPLLPPLDGTASMTRRASTF